MSQAAPNVALADVMHEGDVDFSCASRPVTAGSWSTAAATAAPTVARAPLRSPHPSVNANSRRDRSSGRVAALELLGADAEPSRTARPEPERGAAGGREPPADGRGQVGRSAMSRPDHRRSRAGRSPRTRGPSARRPRRARCRRCRTTRAGRRARRRPRRSGRPASAARTSSRDRRGSTCSWAAAASSASSSTRQPVRSAARGWPVAAVARSRPSPAHNDSTRIGPGPARSSAAVICSTTTARRCGCPVAGSSYLRCHLPQSRATPAR